MALIKMRGTFAVPGEFEYPEGKETKTFEELKTAAQRWPIIPVSYGHTVDGLAPTEEMQIGTVSQKVNEKEQKIDGELWLFPEKIPDVLREKIDNGEKIPISAGILLDSVDDEGIQRGIQYTHLAIVDGENPKCPLEECGFGIRLESDRLMRLEKTTEIEAEKEPEEAPEEVKTTEELLTDTPMKLEPEPEDTETETPVEQKPKEPVEEAPEEEIQLEPETVIPIEAPVEQKPYEVVDGNYVFVFKPQEKKK
ncbi:MAG: hypothetical protein ACXADS_15915 [Candidatus Thorarchaeota archaeon]